MRIMRYKSYAEHALTAWFGQQRCSLLCRFLANAIQAIDEVGCHVSSQPTRSLLRCRLRFDISGVLIRKPSSPSSFLKAIPTFGEKKADFHFVYFHLFSS